TYWDQNTRAAQPLGFFGTVAIRSIPFALMFAAVRADLIGLAVLAAALLVHLSTTAVILGWGFGDREGLRALHLLPVRDVAALGRAQALPSLKVGLHLVLVEGRPVLPPSAVPDLVDAHGEFSTHLVRASLKFFFRRGAKRQLEAEIRAQFQAFHRTGLALDHV